MCFLRVKIIISVIIIFPFPFDRTGENDDYLKIFGKEREIGSSVGHRYPELR